MSNWYDKWRVKVNQSKSIHTTFTLRLALCPKVSLADIPIPSAKLVKYLELTIDRRLTWALHVRDRKLVLNVRLKRGHMASNSGAMPKNIILTKYKPFNTKSYAPS